MVEHGKARKTGEGLITNSLVPSPHLISKSELVKDFKQRSNSIQSDFFFFLFWLHPWHMDIPGGLNAASETTPEP